MYGFTMVTKHTNKQMQALSRVEISERHDVCDQLKTYGNTYRWIEIFVRRLLDRTRSFLVNLFENVVYLEKVQGLLKNFLKQSTIKL